MARGRKQKSSQKTVPLPASPRRPHTRAFTRQKELEKGFSAALPETLPASDTGGSRKTRDLPRARRLTHPEAIRRQAQQTGGPLREELQTADSGSAEPTRRNIRGIPESASLSKALSPAKADNAQDPVVSEWLRILDPTTTEQAHQSFRHDLPLIGHSGRREESMESSSSLSRVSTNTGDDSSTVKDSDKRDKALTWEKLRFRRIFKIATEDVKSAELKSKLVPPTKLPFKELSELVVFLEEMLQKCKNSRPTKDSFPVIEEFKDRFHEWQSGHRIALMTNREFGMDVTYSMSANEAVLQRTIMLSIINRCYINDLFSFNCEGQWKLHQRHRLPSTGRMEQVTLPKPDLAIFFRLNALTGPNIWASYPKEISECLRPDGGEERCFPFFFMEVKRSADNLEAAFRANLHSASQALYNIFQWMSVGELHETFWEKVRVFSMDLNAQEIKLRVHRAALDHDNSLCFHFDDIVSVTNYTRDQACHLVKSVLLDYAKSELHGILKGAFQRVSEREQLLAQKETRDYRNKRRAEPPQSQSSSKRGRSLTGTAVPPQSSPFDPASSFGASGLTI